MRYGTQRTVSIEHIPGRVLAQMLITSSNCFEKNWYSEEELKSEASHRGLVFLMMGWGIKKEDVEPDPAP